MVQTILFGKAYKTPQLEPYIPQNTDSVLRLSLPRTRVEFSARSSGKLNPTYPYIQQCIGADIESLAVVSTLEK